MHCVHPPFYKGCECGNRTGCGSRTAMGGKLTVLYNCSSSHEICMNFQVRELRKTVERMEKQMKMMYRMMTRNGGGSVVLSTSNVKMHKSSLIKYVPIYFLYRMIKTTANTM